MDEQRQPDGTGPADQPGWRGNGALGPAQGAHGRGEDPGWGASEPGWAPAEPARSGADHAWSGAEPARSSADQAWSSAGAALEPPAEPLALLATGREERAAPSPPAYRYAPGLDDDTPAAGVPVTEPPLWREAARYSATGSPVGYGSPLGGGEYASDFADPAGDELAGLPQRVPAEPDVPAVPGDEPGARDRWTAPELAWIADQLRRTDVPQAPVERLDVDAVLEAVRSIAGVREATVRPNPNGVHTLRLDLADDADPGQVSRVVAGLLEERMGLAAAPTMPSGQRQGRAEVPPPRAPAAPPQPEREAPGRSEPRRGTWPDRDPDRSVGPRSGFDPSPAAPEPAQSRHRREPDPPPPVVEPRSLPEPPAEPSVAPPGPPAASLVAPAAPDPAPEPPASPAAADFSPSAGARPAVDRPAGTYESAAGAAEGEPEVVSRPLPAPHSGPRVVIDQVLVSTFGLDATVEVQLLAGRRRARGRATGPAVDSYVMRLAAVSAANAVDELLHGTVPPPTEPALDTGSSRCFVEHTGLVPFGKTEVAVVVLLLVCGGWVEQLTGSALVDNDPRQAMVRATLGAVNRRLEALLG